jgi:RNA polymerase sigma factor (TIGR02999 family)
MSCPSASASVTQLLGQLSGGNRAAVDQLLPLVYAELRRIAGGQLRRERPGHTLQATALVHEAYLQLVDQHSVSWQSRAHFMGVAAQVMRYVLLDYAKQHAAAKRGGNVHKLSLDEGAVLSVDSVSELVTLDEALTHLSELDPQQAKVVELRFYGGLTVEETAEALCISTATVKREWSMARAWLRKQLGKSAAEPK